MVPLIVPVEWGGLPAMVPVESLDTAHMGLASAVVCGVVPFAATV